MVFVHPIGLDRRSWDWVRFPDAIALDLPGHGDAPALGRVSLGALADYVVGQVSGAMDIVGVSLGGMVAQHLALRYPQRVRSAVIACSGAVVDPEVLRGRAAETRHSGMAGTLDATLDRWFSPDVRVLADHPGVAYVRRRLLSDDSEIIAQYWTAMATHDVRSRLGEIKIPVTVVAGADDRSNPVDALKELASALPRCRFDVRPGPHLLHVECPELFTEALEQHFTWVGTLGSCFFPTASNSGREPQ